MFACIRKFKFTCIGREKLPDLGSNSYPLTIRLMVKGYEHGREDHEFDPRLGNFSLYEKRSEH